MKNLNPLIIISRMNGYELSRAWFDFSFEKKEANVYHTSIFVWCIELNNRLGWKKEFGLPTQATMEGLSIGNKNTYLSALKDLQLWGFIQVIKESKNQYQSCIISICHSENDTAQYTALDTALIQHDTQHRYNTVHAIDTIDKPINNKTINKETKKQYATRVHMYEKEFEKLVNDYGIDKTNWMVTVLDHYKVSKGKTYKEDYRAILSWVVGKAEKEYITKSENTSTRRKSAEPVNPYDQFR